MDEYIRMTLIEFYKKLDELTEQGKSVQLTVINMIAILDEIGRIREKPRDKNIIDVEVINE